MRFFSMLKRNSKLALKGNWGRAIILMLILFGVSGLVAVIQQVAMHIFVLQPLLSNPTMEPATAYEAFMQDLQVPTAELIITAFSFIVSIFLLTPLSLGALRWFYNLVHGKSLPVVDMFYFFESGKAYGKSVWYTINVGIRTALWSILFYLVPGSIFGISVYHLSASETTRQVSAIATTGIFLSVILFLLATLFYAVCVARYTLTPYLLSEDANISVGKAIKTSIKYTRGFRFSLIWFELSYIGWGLLSVFFFPLFYVWPYYSTGVSMYARFIIEKNRFEEPELTQEFTANAADTAAAEPVETAIEAPQDPTPEAAEPKPETEETKPETEEPSENQ